MYFATLANESKDKGMTYFVRFVGLCAAVCLTANTTHAIQTLTDTSNLPATQTEHTPSSTTSTVLITLEDPNTRLILPWFVVPLSEALTKAKPLAEISQDIMHGL